MRHYKSRYFSLDNFKGTDQEESKSQKGRKGGRVVEKESSGKIIFSLLMGIYGGLTFMNVPSALDRLMAVYQISYTQISILISSLFWSHALLQLPGGIITDRLGLKPVLMVSLSFISLGNIIAILFPQLTPTLLGRIVTGVGTGLSFTATMKLVALSVPSNRIGMYQAFFGGFFSLGGIAAYLLIPRLVTSAWQWTFIVPAGTGIGMMAYLTLLRFDRVPSTHAKPLPLMQILRIREGWILGIYHALSWGSIISLGNWMPSLLADAWKNTTAAQMAWGGVLVLLISGLGRLSGGFVLIKIPSLVVAHGSLFLLAAIFFALYWIPVPGLVLILALLAAWFASINFGAFFHLASRSVSSQSLATLVGFINFLANLSAIGLTILFGWIRDSTGSFTEAFPVLSIFALAALAIGRRPLQRRVAED